MKYLNSEIYNTSTNLDNMAYPVHNITVTLPMNVPAVRAYGITAKVVFNIVIPLVILGINIISIYILCRKKKTKVIEMIENPLRVDVETPDNREHKDPDAVPQPEEDDQDSNTEPRL